MQHAVVVLNGSDSANGRVFTLAHELAHLMLRGGGVCEFFEHVAKDARSTELFCNRVAASLLMPASAVRGDPDAVRRESVSDSALQRLARRFRVSQEAMLIRLAELGRLPNSVVAPTISLLQRAYRVAEGAKESGEVKIPRHILALKRHGRMFSTLVLSAYGSDAITLSEASNYLELRVKHLEKLRTDLWAKAS